MMAPRSGGVPLEELRKAYQACRAAGGGHCADHVHAEALVEGLEKELRRLSSRIDRSGTVYHVPKAAPAPK